MARADATPPDEPGAWPSNGRTLAEERFSPLDQIDRGNVARLGLAWEADLESPRFGIEATPIVVDGVLYVSSSWSRVFAFDAATGKPLWKYDPQVPRAWLRYGCCKPVNRGVAVWGGKVFVGTFDGRLVAIDAKTGERAWEASTTDGLPYYTITGAPRVVDGKVVIGNGGGDFATRGFFSAYDANTGQRLWRSYVVPGNPKHPPENADMARAAKTWGKDKDWSLDGGGNPWDSFSYDPALRLLYVGTGNAGPYGARNPARGDGLYLASILAVHIDSGRIAWHYQTVPGESWDYNATQNMILADLEIGGKPRKVLMQAPKNGFFYVLDRATGELLSAEKYVRVNWASKVDLETGRPQFTGVEQFEKGPRLMYPAPYGGHNWNPMAYNPQTGLVYIPVHDIGWIFGATRPTFFMEGMDLGALGADADARAATRGSLLAWDPVKQRPVWSVAQETLTNGGVLTTAGGLVVQGTEDGYLRFHDARNGALLAEITVGTGIVAPPVSYRIGDTQYIAVAAGWNGVKTTPWTPARPDPHDNAGRLLVLKLDGGPVRVAARVPLAPFLALDAPQDAKQVEAGADLYQANCAMCHGVIGEGGVYPDLRRMAPGTLENFDRIVRGGLLEAAGMANFSNVITEDDARALRAYIVDWAQRSRRGDTEVVPVSRRGGHSPRKAGAASAS